MNKEEKISVLLLCHYMYCPPISGGAKRMFAPVLYFEEDVNIEFSVMYMSYSKEELIHNENYFTKLNKTKYFRGTLTSQPFQFNHDTVPPDFPKQVWNTMNKDFLDNIISEVQRTEYDIIQITHPQLAWVVPKLRLYTNAKVIMDCQNLEWLVFKRWSKYARPIDREWVLDDYKSLKKWEEMVIDWFDDVFCISKVEKELLTATAKSAKLHYVPTGAGVDDNAYTPKDKSRDKPHDLLFIGSMSWFPTTDALTWLIEKVMPLVWDSNPDVKLEIVGSGEPDSEVIKLLRSDRRITFWGALENEIPLLHQSKVFVSPIRIGAGVRLKNPTAWISQIPIVATGISVEGLDCIDGKDVLIGDTPEEFAEHIINILDNPDVGNSLVENGLKTYNNSYSTEKIMSIWKNAYYSVVSDEKNISKTTNLSNNEGITLLTSFEQVDEFVRTVDKFQYGGQEYYNCVGSHKFDFESFVRIFGKSPPNCDPFSPEYRDYEMSFHKFLSGKDYSISLESRYVSESYIDMYEGSLFGAESKAKKMRLYADLLDICKPAHGMAVLEMGFAWGFLLEQFGRCGCSCTGIDICEGFANYARKLLTSLNINNNIICGSFFDIESADSTFDIVIFSSSFHHCNDPMRLLKILNKKMSNESKIYFLDEAISDDYDRPWGLVNNDGAAIYEIRKKGWCEFGFRLDFFKDLLQRFGFEYGGFHMLSDNSSMHVAMKI
ncbi:MAG: glycosyltransferase [Oscillospiraceae bacterium]|nr:glycosyltransferase [Oscillospiraceae bacterium]MCL2278292.1 glycosyltransferase [Oscillospiraceae bacterium]